MKRLPSHGRVACAQCYGESTVVFDVTKRTEGGWRITCNPLAWGNQSPEVIVLGFSKGPTQAGALARAPHNEIAYRGSRLNVAKILAHIGLIPSGPAEQLRATIDRLISDPAGQFHFASLIRCTIERYDSKTSAWKGSGGGMLDKFVATPFGQEIATNCGKRFLSSLPSSVRLVVMFGLGSYLNYVSAARRVFEQVRERQFSYINTVAYTDGAIVVVHVEHFASQGNLLPHWLGEKEHARAKLGRQAQDAVVASGIFQMSRWR